MAGKEIVRNEITLKEIREQGLIIATSDNSKPLKDIIEGGHMTRIDEFIKTSRITDERTFGLKQVSGIPLSAELREIAKYLA